MPVVDDRVLPLCEIRLYDQGQGDPYLSDRGFGWYDILAHSHGQGTISRTSAGEFRLEFLEGIGLVCRPFVNLKDTRLSHYTVTNGAWEERRPATGATRKYRLLQLDTTANVQWHALSSFSLPENPQAAFTLLFQDAPPDHDAATYPPYVRLEFGNAEWAIEFSKTHGARLLRDADGDGTYDAAQDLGQPTAASDADNTETLILLRCLRGRIGVSMDRGRSYTWCANADGSSITVAAAPFRLRGQGGQVVFGMHQVEYLTGAYTSANRDTGSSRTAAVPTMTGRTNLPAGTSVAVTDAGSAGGGYAAYVATLTPSTVVGVPFTFYRTPELYSVKYTLPIATRPYLQTYSTEWTGAALSVDVQKPLELGGATATLRLWKAAATQFTGDYRWRKVVVRLGYYDTDGKEQWWTAFTGYTKTVTPAQEEYGKATVTVTLENPSIHLRRAEWTDLDSIPFGGLTVNAALDAILVSEGYDSSYRLWHTRGDSVTLPAGLAEDPCEWPKRGERKWETLQRLAGYAGLEVIPTDAGGFITLPLDYVAPFVSHAFRATPVEDYTENIRSLENPYDASESGTAVLVQGTAENGTTLYAYAVDTGAELSPISGRFCPWRELVQEEVDGTVTAGLLTLRAQQLALETFAQKFEPDLVTEINLSLSRRDRVVVEGTYLGVRDWHEHAVMTLAHHVEFDPSFASVTTTAGLRRL